jgi:high affinity Mn2+ porin
MAATSHGAAQRRDSAEVWSFHYQFTGIAQYHGSFHADYSGQNSLSSEPESPFSVTSTLYLGVRLWEGGELYVNPEMSGGSGFSLTRGVAGFPNGEVYRVDDVKPKVFLARAFLRQRFRLSDSHVESLVSDLNQIAGEVPSSRLDVTAGKFSLTDVFDDNVYSHDPRTQFMNWALWAPGAWDYAADTRGYNWGIAMQLVLPRWALNFAAVLVPTTANGPNFDPHVGEAHSLNLELVKPFNLIAMTGRLHVIGFWNQANMGSYQEAINDAKASGEAPDLLHTRSYRSKFGAALGLEQPLSDAVGLFARLSWNDGATETWAFTEIDRSAHVGALIRGHAWNRSDDNIGIAYVANALSIDHSDYLSMGGYGFIIGDGRLNYNLEQIVECFYSARLFPSFWLSLDNQLIINPAYNKDRGPVVNASAIRGHVEF